MEARLIYGQTVERFMENFLVSVMKWYAPFRKCLTMMVTNFKLHRNGKHSARSEIYNFKE